MKAVLTNYRQSPRKVRLVANLVKGKSVTDANSHLYFLTKRSALPVRKLLMSAVANAVNSGEQVNDLFVKSITVDKGVVLKRMMPRAHGSAYRINKRTSHLVVVLGSKNPKAKSEQVKSVSVKAKKDSVSKKATNETESKPEVKSVKKVSAKKAVAKKSAKKAE